MSLEIFKAHYKMADSLNFKKLNVPEELLIKKASDSLLDPTAFIPNIEEDLINIRSLMSDPGRGFNQFYLTTKRIIGEKKKELKNESKKDLDNKNDRTIFSFSDIGPRNMLVNNTDIYFLDFEHSGWDDPVKGIIDLLICPSNNTTDEDAEAIIKYLFEEGDCYIAKDILSWIGILNIKWIVIYAKYAIKMDRNKKLTSKEIDYVYSKGKHLQEHIENVINLNRKNH